MSYTFGGQTALGIVRCSINQSRAPSWLSVSYVALVAAVTFLVGLAADAVAIRVFVVEFLALSTIYNFISHNIRCFYFSRVRTRRNTRQTSRKGRNLGQNVRTRRILFYSLFTPFHSWLNVPMKFRSLYKGCCNSCI